MKAGNKFRIGQEVRTILLSIPEIASVVGNNIFPIFAPEGTTGDFIFYQRDGYFVERTKMGISSQECEMYVGAVSEDYERSIALANLIFEGLDGKYSSPDMEIELTDATEEGAAGKYMQLLKFSIK